MNDQEKQIAKLQAEIEMWKQYAKDLTFWFWKHHHGGTHGTMDAGMSEPNKPGYYRANND